MKKFSKVIALVMAIILAFSLSACSKKAEEKKDGNTTAQAKELKLGATTYFGLSQLDPSASWDGWYLSFYGVGETLFKLDENYKANPWLVKSFKSVDDLTWEFVLRDDVKFHNGEKMTADLVKKSLEYMMTTNTRGPETYNFDTITADGQTLIIKTKTPTPALLTDLCDPISVIQYVSDDMSGVATKSYMTGPYMIEKFTAPGEVTVVKAFPDYWGGAAKVSKASFITYSDQDALAMALQNGEIDMAVMPDNASLSLFKDTKKYGFSGAVSNRGEALVFNLKRCTCQDLAVRTALGFCIDRENFAKSMNGVYNANYGLFPDIMSYGGTKGLKLTVDKFDIESAKKVLADAGYKDTDGDGIVEKNGKKLSLDLIYAGDYNEKVKFAELLESTAKKAGIEIVLKSFSNTKEEMKKGTWDLAIEGVGMAPTGNPQYFINTHWMTGVSGNIYGYSNKKIDELSKKLEQTFAQADRDKLTLEVEQQIMDDMFYQVYANKQFYCVYNVKITGFKAQPSEYYLLDNTIDVKA